MDDSVGSRWLLHLVLHFGTSPVAAGQVVAIGQCRSLAVCFGHPGASMSHIFESRWDRWFLIRFNLFSRHCFWQGGFNFGSLAERSSCAEHGLVGRFVDLFFVCRGVVATGKRTGKGDDIPLSRYRSLERHLEKPESLRTDDGRGIGAGNWLGSEGLAGRKWETTENALRDFVFCRGRSLWLRRIQELQSRDLARCARGIGLSGGSNGQILADICLASPQSAGIGVARRVINPADLLAISLFGMAAGAARVFGRQYQ